MANELNRPIDLSTWSDSEIIDWLGIPNNSLHPELYVNFLPHGIEWVCGPIAMNCFDFAQGIKGIHWLDLDGIELDERGRLVVYFDKYDRPIHAGILIEYGDRVISQWGAGAVFKHRQFQVPAINGKDLQLYSAKYDLGIYENI
ncbi:hypothetical protein COY14_04305 [Candidatus Roizmanbacteria bacterium CG_4_10_14_0_2_um_filter_36_9]|uniref:Uncharacterized protein n=1 Tax=Candidatus Roizmanbacteria bacterium CG_4_10_14_0_2_um_filter_36_9 TaxID=1974823 RepID=A0A2M7U329_9BACT|nr:MAG: hypothetical protein COY14_04305 [Candidatus Roizmanbacteria bacterium CG_4_10_14_0_2_um_filter_36_9]